MGVLAVGGRVEILGIDFAEAAGPDEQMSGTAGRLRTRWAGPRPLSSLSSDRSQALKMVDLLVAVDRQPAAIQSATRPGEDDRRRTFSSGTDQDAHGARPRWHGPAARER